MGQPSAFDEALFQAFIDERPQKKKWSMNVLASNNSSNANSISTLFANDSDLEDVELELGHSFKRHEPQKQLRDIKSSMVDLETIVFDDAIIPERRHDEVCCKKETINVFNKGELSYAFEHGGLKKRF